MLNELKEKQKKYLKDKNFIKNKIMTSEYFLLSNYGLNGSFSDSFCGYLSYEENTKKFIYKHITKDEKDGILTSYEDLNESVLNEILENSSAYDIVDLDFNVLYGSLNQGITKENTFQGIVETYDKYELDLMLFLEDYALSKNKEAFSKELSQKKIKDSFYEISFISKDNKNKKIIIFPDLNYKIKSYILDKNKVIAEDDDARKEYMNKNSQYLDAEYSYGCILVEMIEDNPNFVEAKSISIDDLNFLLTEASLSDLEARKISDTLTLQLLKNYLVQNEGPEEKTNKSTFIDGVTFYIDENKEYVVEYVINDEEKKKSFKNFNDFVNNEEVNKDLRICLNKKITLSKSLYDCYERLLLEQIKDAEEKRLLKLINREGDSYFEVNPYSLDYNKTFYNIPQKLTELFKKENVLSDGEDKFSDIKDIYNQYGLDFNQLREDIEEFDSAKIIREKFIRDFDRQYYLQFKKYYNFEIISNNDYDEKTHIIKDLLMTSLVSGVTKESDNVEKILRKGLKEGKGLNPIFENNVYIQFVSYNATVILDEKNNDINIDEEIRKFKENCSNFFNMEENIDESLANMSKSKKYWSLLRYLDSEIRYPDDSPELKSLIKAYEKIKETTERKEDVEDTLKKILNINASKIIDEEENLLDKIFNQDGKKIFSFNNIYETLDFNEVMRRTLDKLTIEDNNMISFPIFNGNGVANIVKIDNDKYSFSIDAYGKEPKEIVLTQKKIIELLNYKDDKGRPFLEEDEKTNVQYQFIGDVINSMQGEFIKIAYDRPSEKADKFDTTELQIFKELARGKTAVFNKSMKMGSEHEDFIMFQMTKEGDIIKKSIKVLDSSKTLTDYSSFKDNTKPISEEEYDGKLVRKYAFDLLSKEPKKDNLPDIRITTEKMTAKDLSNFINKTYLREYKISFSDYKLSLEETRDIEKEEVLNFGEKDIRSDKSIYNFAKSINISKINNNDINYLLSNKIMGYLGISSSNNTNKNENEEVKEDDIDKANKIKSCSFASFNESNKYGEAVQLVFSISPGESKDGSSVKTFDISVVENIYSKKQKKHFTRGEILKDALYLDKDENGQLILKISNRHKAYTEELLRSINENFIDTDECTKYFQNVPDKDVSTKKINDNVSNYAKVLSKYGQNDLILEDIERISKDDFNIISNRAIIEDDNLSTIESGEGNKKSLMKKLSNLISLLEKDEDFVNERDKYLNEFSKEDLKDEDFVKAKKQEFTIEECFRIVSIFKDIDSFVGRKTDESKDMDYETDEFQGRKTARQLLLFFDKTLLGVKQELNADDIKKMDMDDLERVGVER